MEIIGREQIDSFKQEHPDARSHMDSWVAEVEEAHWQSPHDLLRQFPKADIPGNHQAIFDIVGNRYRLLVKIAYKLGVVFVKAVGTHKEYEGWKIK